MRGFAAALCFLFSGSSPGPVEAPSEVRLTISQGDRVGTLSQGPLVKITIDVVGKKPWVLFSDMERRPPGGPRSPVSYVSFEITGDDGAVLQALPSHGRNRATSPNEFVDYPVPGVWLFLVMRPNDIWGRVISLGDGSYLDRITKPGQYRIRARFETDAGRWLRQRIANGDVPKESVQFDPGWIVDGTFFSNELSIRLDRP